MPEEKYISFSFSEYERVDELNPDDRELVNAAIQIALNAYSPYSGFRVGAAIRLESGKIICGANVENAAFPAGICAERNALSNAVTNHPGDKPVALAISAFNSNGQTEEPVTPCGICRQVLAEEETKNGKSIKTVLAGKNKIYVIGDVSSLLPMQFNKRNLKISLP